MKHRTDNTWVRPEATRWAPNGMVCSVDHLASNAGVRILQAGGSAADAAIATSAVLAVTTQNMCGMGGDLWALVHYDDESEPATLNASGRAGSGSDAEAMRAEGLARMPFRGDIRSVPVPGCVDGWVALHERFGVLGLPEVLAPAIGLALNGFPVGPLTAAMIPLVAEVEGSDDFFIGGKPAEAGERVTRPGLARALADIGNDGRSAWYEGEFGEGLRRLGESAGGLYTASDLARTQADWVEPVGVNAWGHRLWTVPPNSQGYLSLAGAVIAQGLDLPADPADPLWAHLLIESAKQAAYDRKDHLYESADGQVLVSEERLGPRRQLIRPDAALQLDAPGRAGDTIYMCAVDSNRMAVSLIQSNAAGFGAHLAVPEVGVFLHNRGIGFSLQEDHPAELQAGARPPSTLAPAMVTRPDGGLRSVLGTMGGDGQPQVVLQMLARSLQAHQSPGVNLSAPRFTLTVPDAAGFDTWDDPGHLVVAVEAGSKWVAGLEQRGHQVREDRWGLPLYGHAHMIAVGEGMGDAREQMLAGCADPRALTGAAAGY